MKESKMQIPTNRQLLTIISYVAGSGTCTDDLNGDTWNLTTDSFPGGDVTDLNPGDKILASIIRSTSEIVNAVVQD